MEFGLFNAIGTPTVPSGTTLVQTSGYSAPGRGNANYAYDSSITGAAVATYLAANPRTSFKDSTNRVFRLAETRRTPQMFGAVGDGSTDDSAALQAFFDDAADAENAKRNTYDFSGTFATNAALFATYPLDNIVRRFQAGTIIVLPVSTPIVDVLTISGYAQVWQGDLMITDNQAGNTAYSSRRFHNGVHLLLASQSYFESIHVDGARRDAVNFDSEQESWSLRSGTYARSGLSKNNIGIQVGQIYARGCGSCHQSTGYGHSLAMSQKTAGGDDPFTTSGNFAGSHLQRTLVTVASTDELRAGDVGKVRLELPSTTYTSIAADNSTGKLTWTAGDPVAAGLVVGDKIVLEDVNGVGSNDGIAFEIVAFGGTSNREISVYPKPATETAKAYSRVITGWSLHQIMKVVSSTQFTVYPWIPNRANSSWYSMHGAVANVHGGDTANIHIGYCSGLLTGTTLRSAGLYGTKVDTLLTDYGEIGLVQGRDMLSVNLGTVVDQIHTEACEVNILQITGGGALDVKGASNLYPDRIHALRVRLDPSNAFPGNDALSAAHIGLAGRTLDFSFHGQHSGDNYFLDDSAVTNSPSHSDVQMTSFGGSVMLDYDFELGRLFGLNRAELFWIGTNGAAPTGNLAFQLSPKLTQMGWAMVGSSSVTAPPKPCFFKIRFYAEGKKIFINRFDAV